ncbi:LAFA_0D12310g1_1 [Lachancea sp. 'fantastica']|nr:LAFA_0D12310g1_1 [Lachancea sp. 'fantastica']
MSLRGSIITTKNAIVTSEKALLLNHGKYLPPVNLVNEYPEEDALRICYRRFVRLTPLVSQRQMVRTTYVHYLRYKFKSENYARKVSVSAVSLPSRQRNILDEVERSLLFCVKAVSDVKKKVENEETTAKEIRIARSVLKNIMTMEFEKMELISKDPKQNHKKFRQSFSYLLPSSRSSPLDLRFSSFKHFDECLILLNETLGTRL